MSEDTSSDDNQPDFRSTGIVEVNVQDKDKNHTKAVLTHPEKLGQGVFGEAWACDISVRYPGKELKGRVAVKIAPYNEISKTELYILLRLSHNNVVRMAYYGIVNRDTVRLLKKGKNPRVTAFITHTAISYHGTHGRKGLIQTDSGKETGQGPEGVRNLFEVVFVSVVSGIGLLFRDGRDAQRHQA